MNAFGHIHEGSGVDERNGTTFVNASICDASYRPIHPCRVIDIDVASGSAVVFTPPAGAPA